MSEIITAPINYAVIAGGNFVSGGAVVFGVENVKPDAANPATLKSVYLDSALLIEAQNPQPLNSSAVFDQSPNGVLYGADNDKYSIVIYDRSGAELSYIPSYNLSDANAALDAQQSASEAAASAGEAATSAENAKISEDAAEASLNEFVDQYWGAYATEPALSPIGNPATVGDLYFNTTDSSMKVYDGAVWGNVGSSVNGLRDEFSISNVAGQDTFLFTYDPDYVDVFYNGVKLLKGIEYDASSGTQVVLATPVKLSTDVINAVAYNNVDFIDMDEALVTARGTTEPRALADRFGDFVTPVDFGAVGDGVNNDTAAVNAAIQDGRPVDWLDLEYGVTGISETVAHDIKWKSNGALIKNISATAIGRTIELFIGANTVSILGGLTIDANDKSYIGLRIENTSEGKSTLVAEDLTCINAYRSGTDFVGGAGLNIKGWFERVHLTRPTIKNCHLGAGAGIAGIAGISGILIEPKSTTPFQAVEKFHVEDPYIEDVYSDDLLYVIDQDGINFRTASDDPLYSLPWPTDFNVIGGVFKNCWGRSIKCQSENGNVDGTQFIRTTGNEHNGSEIDFQVGAGSVSNIKCIYESFTPNWVVTLSGARRVDKLVPFGSVSGVKVSIASGETINAVVNCANREFVRQSWIVRDINIRGATDYIVRLTGGTSATNILSLSDVTVDILNEYGVWTGINSFSSESKCIIKRVFHAGSDVPLMRASAATSPILSSEDCFGFTESTKVDQEGSGDVGSFLRVDKIAPIDAKESGFLKPFSFLMADDDIVSLPIVGYNSGSNMAILSVSSNKQGKAIITYDTGSATKITSEGTNFETGTTTEPATGSFRLWASGGTLQISNRSGTQRMITGLMIG